MLIKKSAKTKAAHSGRPQLRGLNSSIRWPEVAVSYEDIDGILK
jgi:hypothetical protein